MSKEILEELLKQEIEEKDVIKLDRYDIGVSLIQPTLNVVVEEIDAGQIYIPPFQRFFRWSKEKASKLIESFLLGLPVPPIFIFLDENNRKVVIDGQQRLLSVYFFFKGIFPKKSFPLNFTEGRLSYILEKERKKLEKFDLIAVDDRWEGKTYLELSKVDKNWLSSIPVWMIVVRQVSPVEEIGSSFFYIFERLNTGGEILSPMEIRRALFYSKYIILLEKLNKDTRWRKIIGKKNLDQKLMDVELILRIHALSENWTTYTEPMKEFLNEFAKRAKKYNSQDLKLIKDNFNTLFDYVSFLGEKPFHKISRRLNTGFLDSFCAILLSYISRKNNLDKREIVGVYNALVKDEEFIAILKKGRVSTDERSLKKRFSYVNGKFLEVFGS